MKVVKVISVSVEYSVINPYCSACHKVLLSLACMHRMSFTFIVPFRIRAAYQCFVIFMYVVDKISQG